MVFTTAGSGAQIEIWRAYPLALVLAASERASSFATLWFLGKVELRSGNAKAALAVLERAHAINPEQPDGIRELVSAHLELGQTDDAVPLARRAVELAPDDAGLRCNLALVLLLAGDVDAAHETASAALESDAASAEKDRRKVRAWQWLA